MRAGQTDPISSHCAALWQSQNKRNFGSKVWRIWNFKQLPANPQQYATGHTNSSCFNNGGHLTTFQANNKVYCICRKPLPLSQQQHEQTSQSHQSKVVWNPEYQKTQLCQDCKSKTAAHMQETQWKSSLETCDSPSTRIKDVLELTCYACIRKTSCAETR